METCQWNRKAPVGIIGWLRLEGALRIITPHGAQPQGRHSSVFSPQLAANHFRGSFMHSCSLAISPLTQSVNCSQAVHAMPDRLICSENPNPPRAPLHLSVTDSKCFFCPPPSPPRLQCQPVELPAGLKLDLITKVHCNDFSDFSEGSQGLCKFACFSIFGFV